MNPIDNSLRMTIRNAHSILPIFDKDDSGILMPARTSDSKHLPHPTSPSQPTLSAKATVSLAAMCLNNAESGPTPTFGNHYPMR